MYCPGSFPFDGKSVPMGANHHAGEFRAAAMRSVSLINNLEPIRFLPP
jgi:hypothetical protein